MPRIAACALCDTFLIAALYSSRLLYSPSENNGEGELQRYIDIFFHHQNRNEKSGRIFIVGVNFKEETYRVIVLSF
jgi:hypothetical protein